LPVPVGRQVATGAAQPAAVHVQIGEQTESGFVDDPDGARRGGQGALPACALSWVL